MQDGGVKGASILCFGEVLLRLTPNNPQADPLIGLSPNPFFPSGASQIAAAGQFDAWWGGSEANVAVGLARLGVEASILTSLPGGVLGKAADAALKEAGVQVVQQPRDRNQEKQAGNGACSDGSRGRLGLYFATTQAQGKVVHYDRTASAFALYPPRSETVSWSHYSHFHTSGINPPLSSSCRSATEELLKTAKEQGLTTSLDLNLRSQLWSDSDAGRTLRPMLNSVDTLFANRSQLESAFALGQTDLKQSNSGDPEIRKLLVDYSLGKVVVTERATNPRGEIALHASGQTTIGANHCRTPWFRATDRIGSGDAFTAGFLAAMNPSAEKAPADGRLRHCLEMGLAASSLANQSAGDFPTFNTGQLKARHQEFFNDSGSKEVAPSA